MAGYDYDPNETISTGTITAHQWDVLIEGNTKINGDLIITGEIKGGEKDMMGLYEVNVVDTKKNEEVAENIRVIAKDEDKAKMFAVTELGKPLDIENYQFFVRCIGQWESKKPKEVKIVKEE